MCVAPCARRRTSSASSTSPWWKLRFGWLSRSVLLSASRCRLSRTTISFSSISRCASLVPMKPAPPLMKIRFPLRATAASLNRQGAGQLASAAVRTVLFVGAGRHQRRAILRAKELGLRVVTVDASPEAPGLAHADVPVVLDFRDVAAVTEVGRANEVEGVLTVSVDRAVPVVAAVAERLGLPGIGTRTAHLVTHKVAMGRELNGMLSAPAWQVKPLPLSHRLRPPGHGFGVGWLHVYPSELFGDTLAEAERIAAQAVRTLGLRNGIAFPQLLVSGGEVRVVEVAARIPGGQMADLAWHAVGVDLVEIALRQALGEEVPDEMIQPRFSKPLAIRFFTSSPGPLPSGKVKSIGGPARRLASAGVLQGHVFIAVRRHIPPARRGPQRP